MSSPVDIRADHLEIVQGILREHLPGGVNAWVFGSRADWTTKDSSDLDLALEGKSKLDRKVLGALADAFEDSDLPYTVDIVDINRVSENFRRIVDAERAPLSLGGKQLIVRSNWHKAAPSNSVPFTTLGCVAEIVMGQSPPGNTVSQDGKLPLLNGPTEFGSHHPTPVQYTVDPRKQARGGDILFCVRGSTTGRMNWADQDYAIGRGIAAIRHKKDLTLQPFVRAVVESQLHELLAQATGSTFPNVFCQTTQRYSFSKLGH